MSLIVSDNDLLASWIEIISRTVEGLDGLAIRNARVEWSMYATSCRRLGIIRSSKLPYTLCSQGLASTTSGAIFLTLSWQAPHRVPH